MSILSLSQCPMFTDLQLFWRLFLTCPKLESSPAAASMGSPCLMTTSTAAGHCSVGLPSQIAGVISPTIASRTSGSNSWSIAAWQRFLRWICDLYCCLDVCLVVVAISLDNISFETLKRAIWHLDAHLAVVAGHGGVLRCGTDWAAHPLSLAKSLKWTNQNQYLCYKKGIFLSKHRKNWWPGVGSGV